MEIRTTDYHTAGEPFRIVEEGVVAVPGMTVAARREHAAGSEAVEAIRRLLCHEPRGHADMYGGFLVPPDDDGADLGVLFWHKDGYSTACGHGTIALGAWAVDSGRVAAPADGAVKVTIDVPSGRVTATVSRRAGLTERVVFGNVPAFVIARGVAAGDVEVDLAFGQRNVAIFADGEVDRSPTGSATSARTALLVAEGVLAQGERWRNDSIIGTTFHARAIGPTAGGLRTEVEGMAHRTGENRFVLDPRDPLGTGFVLR